MEHSESESKLGLYDVYHTQDGKKLIVLQGLSPDDQYHAPVLQQLIHQHFGFIATFYWVLFVVVLSYMIYNHIVKPLRGES